MAVNGKLIINIKLLGKKHSIENIITVVEKTYKW